MTDGTIAQPELYMVEVWNKETEDCVYVLLLADSKGQAVELAKQEIPIDVDWDEIGTKCENILHISGPARVLWAIQTYGG
jgi:hypothetical protein